MTYDDWVEFGIANNYCSEPFCATHDNWPLHPSEEDELEQGYDPCHVMIRLGKMEDWDISPLRIVK